MPVSKSKSASKDKPSARAAAKKQLKASKNSASKNSNRSSAATTAHNPVDELVHTVEISSTLTAASLHSDNGHFQNMEDTDDHSSSPRGTASDFDLSSNNGSCSGESEDPKEKTVDSSNHQERASGCDHEKREKIRLKNEKKHQRQKEKRAQELHERCKGYLMSRKLEALSQQLVTMGFSPERATMALMLNEGKLEESVSWLFEGNEEEARNKDTANSTSVGNLKIDISSELAHISALEARYKFSKQEVERAVVACGGDLGKAEGMLRDQKQKESVSQSSHDVVGETKCMTRAQEMPGSASVFAVQSNKNDRESSCNSAVITVPAWLEAGNRSIQQSSKTTNPPRLLRGGEKRWPAVGSGLSSSTSTPPLPVVHHSHVKAEAQIGVSKSEAINLRREIQEQPVEPVFMQQPQPVNGLQNAVSSSMLPGTTPWYSNNAPTIKNVISSDTLLHNNSTMSLGSEHRKLEQIYHQAIHNQPQFMSGLDITWAKENAPLSHSSPSDAQSLWRAGGGTLSSFAVPSNYGLSSNLSQGSPVQTSGLLSQMDWNIGGLMPYCDYNRIDWTLHSPSSRLSESAPLRNSSGRRVQGGGGVKDMSPSGGLRDWTSPFAGNDLFSAPRQLVTSPFP
ncbi:uncharacterized protein LOC111798347 [Cucurbita pepo subsp. pepo]|uniref:uncharacterized protein LOC111798347 n=1 Tax=Cucurbita pepo subsp. pepo TaxID=3664 RepID=UPI000C9D7C3A|nr:uncharacterized protein LOC111798347 [Cucurbita pepo subsp. pepo]XP_023537206.1 uncharacterized protein LOC111798347 [Cucurbita pepo subsp. pepo]XP_023537215.1 uncharacterized protein LOC111798347 [Cucurbita pepo subsp. pepo]